MIDPTIICLFVVFPDKIYISPIQKINTMISGSIDATPFHLISILMPPINRPKKALIRTKIRALSFLNKRRQINTTSISALNICTPVMPVT